MDWTTLRRIVLTTLGDAALFGAINPASSNPFGQARTSLLLSPARRGRSELSQGKQRQKAHSED